MAGTDCVLNWSWSAKKGQHGRVYVEASIPEETLQYRKRDYSTKGRGDEYAAWIWLRRLPGWNPRRRKRGDYRLQRELTIRPLMLLLLPRREVDRRCVSANVRTGAATNKSAGEQTLSNSKYKSELNARFFHTACLHL